MAVDSGSLTPETLARRIQIAQLAFDDSLRPRPIQHWAQGLAQMAHAGLAGYRLNKAESAEEARLSADRRSREAILGGLPGLGDTGDTSTASSVSSAVPTLPSAPPRQSGGASLPPGGQPSGGGMPQPPPGAPIQQATDGIISAIDPDTGEDIAPRINAAGQAAADRQRGGTRVAAGPTAVTSDATAGEMPPELSPQQRINQGFGTEPNPTQFEIARLLTGGQMAWPNPRGAGASAGAMPPPMPPPMPAGASGIPSVGLGAEPGADPSAGRRAVAAAMTPPPAPVPPMRPQAVAPTASGAPQIPPAMVPTIRALMRSSNPQDQARGWALYSQYAKPTEQYLPVRDEGGRIIGQRNSVSGKVEPYPQDEAPGARELEYGLRNWQKLGLPDPNAADPQSREFWRSMAARRLGGAGVNVTVDQKSEGEFAKNAAKHQAARFDDVVKAGYEAQSMVADLDALREIGARIGSGKSAEIVAALGPWAQAAGVEIKGLGDLQAFRAIAGKMAPRMRPPGSGATSDFEMRSFLESLPSLGKTPEGNEIVANTLQALQEHRIAAADIASRALAGELTQREAEKKIRELPNPMQMWRKSRGVSPAADPTKLKSKYGLE